MKIGVISGGQLCRMIGEQIINKRLPHSIITMDPTPHCPAYPFVDHQIVADFKDKEKILELAKEVDLITFDVEYTNTEVLKQIRDSGKEIYPSPDVMHTIRNKNRQKTFLKERGIPVADFTVVESKEDIIKTVEEYGYPVLLKSCEDSYDGHGNAVLHSEDDIDAALEKFSGKEVMLERFVSFEKELSIMIAKSTTGELALYPLVENIHKDNILHTTIAPARVSEEIVKKAQDVGLQVLKELNTAGIFGVELFLTTDGEILLNEIAPRCHNSGHYTIEGCKTSQFEQQIRAVTGMPLGDTSLVSPVIMHNILGPEGFKGSYSVVGEDLLPENAYLHMYGKHESRPRRKLGHISIATNNDAEAEQAFSTISLVQRGVCPIEIRTGSDSDIPKMKELYGFLDEIGLKYSPRILSAHRTPEFMVSEAQDLEKNNFRVSIAAAGGSAHIAGMTASETQIPVVALPIKSSFGGQDALFSMAQMPPAIPNGCVGIGQDKEAGILAARIATLDDKETRQKIAEKLGTKVIADLSDHPEVSIITDDDSQDFSLLDQFGVSYTVNKGITSPVVIYCAEFQKFPDFVDAENEQISITAPLKTKDFSYTALEQVVAGPYASVGVGRVKNALIYAAQVIGLYFPQVKERLVSYRANFARQVREKDSKLQKEGIRVFLE